MAAISAIDTMPASSPLIGRDQEVSALVHLLHQREVRLLTLHGPGGVGKTRLALRVADLLRDLFLDGVLVVPLAALSDPRLVVPTIAQALGLRESGGQPVQESLKTYLRSRTMLLLLDNVEQVSAAASEVANLLAASPGLTVLATSRVALGVPPEQGFPVHPLALPDLAQSHSVEALLQSAAVQLFAYCAQSAGAGFQLTPANAPTIAAICRRLDGLPLAITLAAAWVTTLSPQALLAQLDGRLPAMAGGPRALPARQQTLRSTIAWSYDLLDPAEQALFRRLAVFVGGCTPEAAAAVYAAQPSGTEAVRQAAARHGRGSARTAARSRSRVPIRETGRAETSDGETGRAETSDGETGRAETSDGETVRAGIAALAAKSLLRTVGPGALPQGGGDGHDSYGPGRVEMLETVRVYGLERLETSGEAATIRHAHAAYYLSLVEAAEAGLRGPDEAAWLARLEQEHDNLRAALQWARETRTVEPGLRLAGVLGYFWHIRGHLTEGLRWLDELLALAEEDGTAPPLAVQAKALSAAGTLAYRLGQYQRATILLTHSLGLYDHLDDRAGRAAALAELGTVMSDQGNYARAVALVEESLALYRGVGDVWGIAASLRYLALLAREQGDYPRATALSAESLDLCRDVGDTRGVAWALLTLSDAARDQGDAARVRALCEESLAFFRAQRDALGTGYCLNNLGLAARAEGDLARARALCEEGLAVLRDLGSGATAEVLASLGAVAREQGDARRAEALFAESLALSRAGVPQWIMAADLEGLAAIAAADGQMERAARLFSIADSLRAAVGVPRRPAECAVHDRTVAAVRTALGPAAFAAAWAAGSTLTVEQAVSEATGPPRADDRRRETEADYRSIFQASGDGLIITTLQMGLVVEANEAACRMLGYAHEELVGLYLTACVQPDARHRLVEGLRAVEGGGTCELQAFLRRKDGTPLPAEVSGTAFIYRGTPHHLIVVRDVTARVQAEERLWETEAQYHGIFEATSDGLIIMDQGGLIVEANAAACQMHGYTHAELVGLPVDRLIQPDRPHLVAELAQRAADGGSFQAQTAMVRKDGTAIPVEVRGRGLTYRGRPHLLAVVRDVTARVHAYDLLEQRVADRTRELAGLLDVAHDVAATLELAPLLGLILDHLKAVIGYSSASIATLHGEMLTVVGYRGPLPHEQAVGRSMNARRGVAREVVRTRQPVLVGDVRGDSAPARAWAATCRDLLGEQSVVRFGYVRSWLGVPLLLKERVIGMLSLSHDRPDYYTPQHIGLARAIAAQAAVAIENARLYEQAQEVAALEERQRLARELHDSVSQVLYSIALGARTARTLLDRDPTPSGVAEPLDYVLSLAEAGLAEMRALIFELRSDALETEGLVTALEKQVAAVQARHGIAVDATLGPEPEVPLEVKEALYRVAQEALHNTVKHAHAGAVRVSLCCTEQEVSLEIADDGRGFDPTAAYPGHLGLRSMHERVDRVGGTLHVESAAGAGTRVRAAVSRSGAAGTSRP